MKQFQHPELIKCNPLIEPINEQANESSDGQTAGEGQPASGRPKPPAKPSGAQYQHRILHPELSSSSLPSTVQPSAMHPAQNVYTPTTMGPSKQPTFMMGTAGPGATYRYRPTLGQQVLVNTALKRNRRHTLANVRWVIVLVDSSLIEIDDRLKCCSSERRFSIIKSHILWTSCNIKGDVRFFENTTSYLAFESMKVDGAVCSRQTFFYYFLQLVASEL